MSIGQKQQERHCPSIAETGTGAQVDMTSVAGAEANYLVGDFVAS